MAALTSLYQDINDSTDEISTNDDITRTTPFVVLIEDELVKVASLTHGEDPGDPGFEDCLRGYGPSVAVAHDEDTPVYQVVGIVGSGSGFVVNYVDADGTVATRGIGTGSGDDGGSSVHKVISKMNLNGFFTDLELPENTEVLLVDARAKEWLASHLYKSSNGSCTIIPVGGDYTVVFSLVSSISGLSGASEPEWAEGQIIDYEIGWETVMYDNRGWASGQDETDYYNDGGDGTKHLFKNNCLFASNNGGGTSGGGAEPTWSTAPAKGDTIVDGTITWTNVSGPIDEWAASTAYHITVDPDDHTKLLGEYVVPVTPLVDGNGSAVFFVYRTGGGDQLAVGTTDTDEPDWDENVGNYTLDGGCIWQAVDAETTPQQVVLSGLKPPGDSGPNCIKLVLQHGNGLQIWPRDTMDPDDDTVIPIPDDGWGFFNAGGYSALDDNNIGEDRLFFVTLPSAGQAVDLTYDDDMELWTCSVQGSTYDSS